MQQRHVSTGVKIRSSQSKNEFKVMLCYGNWQMILNAMSGMVPGAGHSCPVDGSPEAATCIAAYTYHMS